MTIVGYRMTDKTKICVGIGLGLFVLMGRGAEPQATYSRKEALKKFVRPASVPQPKANPSTPERENLGKILFFDPRLSGANSISCASCHNPSFSWSDGLPKGIGHGSKPVGRHTPTILNTAFAELLFWDGRAESLEEQALGPIGAPGEMNMPLTELPAKLAKIPGYTELFEKAYPGEGVTEKTIAKAIAAFERTIVSSKAPFDHWVEGKEEAITTTAKRGFDLFNTKASCVQCHAGWNFSDDGFHDIGLPGDDIGRGKYLKEIEIVQHAFKTPTLRNITRRAPYMHDGSEATLEGTVQLYNLGGRVKRPSLAQEIHPLGLTPEEIHDVCEFMKTLTSNDKPLEVPTLPN
jgi:cytochrome c peroxidase